MNVLLNKHRIHYCIYCYTQWLNIYIRKMLRATYDVCRDVSLSVDIITALHASCSLLLSVAIRLVCWDIYCREPSTLC